MQIIYSKLIYSLKKLLNEGIQHSVQLNTFLGLKTKSFLRPCWTISFLNWSENLGNDQSWSCEVFPHDKQCSHYVSLDLSLCSCWTQQQSEDDSHQRDSQGNVNAWLIFTDGAHQCVCVCLGILLPQCSHIYSHTLRTDVQYNTSNFKKCLLLSMFVSNQVK